MRQTKEKETVAKPSAVGGISQGLRYAFSLQLQQLIFNPSSGFDTLHNKWYRTRQVQVQFLVQVLATAFIPSLSYPFTRQRAAAFPPRLTTPSHA